MVGWLLTFEQLRSIILLTMAKKVVAQVCVDTLKNDWFSVEITASKSVEQYG